MMLLSNNDYLCLAIGNSRLHWALFQQDKLRFTWDTQHLSQPITDLESFKEIFPTELGNLSLNRLPLYIASVVPSQTNLWQNNSSTRLINLKDIPLKGIYPTMGIDRAIALLGAIEVWGYPCLVIDAGTALTFTGVGEDKELIGGAILPGLTLQLKSLQQKTAALPEIRLPERLPQRWTIKTEEAIASGVIYTAIAGIKDFIDDWLQQFPDAQIVLTGGDAELIFSYLQTQNSEIDRKIAVDRHLVFWGMRSLIYFLPIFVLAARDRHFYF
jgi:type III pantothenate kinase